MSPLLRARIAGQAGLVTRAQALDAGMTDRAIEWRLGRGWWLRVHPGVYLTTPGRLDWEMRAVAALLLAGPGAALAGRSAGHAWGLVVTAPSVVELVIPARRRVRPVAGIEIRRSRHVPDRIHQTAWPHRVAAEHTVFDLTQGATIDRCISPAARAIGNGVVATQASLLRALHERHGQSQRRVWAEMLADIGAGAESPAEVRYLRDVERAHNLPVGMRQAPTVDGGRRDVEYKEWHLIVEVDGRFGHEGWRARQREGRPDRKAATNGRITVRCHWPDLVPTGCDLAADLCAILMTRGWPGPGSTLWPELPGEARADSALMMRSTDLWKVLPVPAWTELHDLPTNGLGSVGRPAYSGSAMRDFPPDIRAYTETGRAGDEPDTRSPRTFLRWMVVEQGRLFWFGLFVALIWMVPQTLGPWIVGRAIDTGIVAGDSAATVKWVVVLAIVTLAGALSGIVFHTVIVREWLIALYGTTMLVTRKALRLGHVLTRRTPTGEVLSVSGSDGDQFGALMEITTRAFSQLAAYLVVAAIVLTTSVRMGLLVLVSAPLLVLLGAPLLRPMQRWQGVERSRNSELTSMATDIVAGLRILRGIGGEETFGGNYAAQSQRVRQSGVAAGRWLSAVESVGVLLSGSFVVALLWLGTRELAVGRLTVGQFVSFLGYGLFLVQPMRTFVEFAQKWTRSVVSARKAIAVYEQRSPWHHPTEVRELPSAATIVDELSGVTISPGRLTMVVSAVPDDSAALADRLGRYLPNDEEALVSEEVPEDLKGREARRERSRRAAARAAQADRDDERARRPWGVTVGGVDLFQVPLEVVRERILVSDTTPQVFAGTLRSAVDPLGRLTREQAEQALYAAAADDVFDALPGGWQGELDERGRGLSGGQRQRLVLMRALAADPEVLVLVEPTSAVDAHTEASIASRLGEHRAGRTTVVMTASPLLLHHADEVVLLVGGRVSERGQHADLLAGSATYRAVVVRGDLEPDDQRDSPDSGVLASAGEGAR